MRFQPNDSQGPDHNPYFTLKYLAGCRGMGSARPSIDPASSWTALREEADAKSCIDAILSVPSPELELWRERQEIEVRLFGLGRPYTPFL
jgi:hypothetical protein